MKGCILIFITFIFSSLNAQQTNFSITGVLKGLGNKKVILENRPRGYSQAFKIVRYDSCISKNDTFYFSGTLQYPDFYSIWVDGTHIFKSFILSEGNVLLKGHVDSAYKSEIIGSREEDLFDSMELKLDPYWRQNNSYVNKLELLRKNNLQNSAEYDSLKLKLNNVIKRKNELVLDFVRTHPDDFVSLIYLLRYVNSLNDRIDLVREYYNAFSKRIKDSPKGQKLYYILYQKDAMNKPGAQVPDFSIIDQNGHTRTLSDYKGKYVLLDFWASWCGPCLAQLPELKEIYNRYNPEGFEILGISLDIDKANWLAAIVKHEMPWATFCDEQGAESYPYRIFGASVIPFTVLLNREGKTININPDMGTLKKELERLFPE